MGANCCVATRHKALAHRTHTHRDVGYSPSWSFQWDNRACVEDVSIDPPRFSDVNNRNVGSEIKRSIDTEIGGLSDGGSALDSSETPKWHQSPVYGGTSGASKGGMEGPPPLWHSGRRKRRKGRAGVADGGNGSRVMATVDQTMVEDDSFIRSNSSPEGMEHMEPATESSQRPNASRHTISLPSSAVRGGPSTSRSYSLPADPTSSRNVWKSPGDQLSRQISDSQIPTCKSVNEKNSAEGRQSDLPAGESHGGSSDGWSMRMFSELVASSQRERWSFDSEYTACSYGKITRSNSHPLVSSSLADSDTCGICSKLVKERSSWSRVYELSVVAVLACGHVYHADCLETLTTDTHRYDPSCPVCIDGEKYPLETSGKGKTSIKGRSKISRNAVADINLDGISITERRKSAEREAKVSKLGSISSFKSFGRPFLRRHFSLSSRPMRRPPSENEQTRKKGFWGRYWK